MTQPSHAIRRRSPHFFVVPAAVAALLALAPARTTSAASPQAKSAAKSAKANGKKDNKKNGKNGKKTAKSSPPRHHHSEQHVVAMKCNQPNVQSLGALVIDLDTGHELFARRPDNPRPIASISAGCVPPTSVAWI